MRRSVLLLPLLALALVGAAPGRIALFRHAQPVTIGAREIDGQLYLPARDVERLIGDTFSRKPDETQRPARGAEPPVIGRTPGSLAEIDSYKGYASEDGLRVKLISYVVSSDAGAYHYGFEIKNEGRGEVAFRAEDPGCKFFIVDSDENLLPGYKPSFERLGKSVPARLGEGESLFLFVDFDEFAEFGPYRTTARLVYDRAGKRIVQPFVFYGFERKVEQP